MAKQQGVIWGPPGTGKTFAGCVMARQWYLDGAGPNEVAYLGFTKAAAIAAAARIREDHTILRDVASEERFPLFRTIHSLAYRGALAQDKDRKVVLSADMRRFSKESGFDVKPSMGSAEDLSDIYETLATSGRSIWDVAFAAYQLTRVTSASQDDLEAARATPGRATWSMGKFLAASVYKIFVEKYEAWKKREGLLDFTDMLEFAMEEMPALDDCKLAIIDEAQDLCPLHYAILDRLFENTEQLWLIGDDDQAIYRFSGASADLFLDRAARSNGQIQLTRTHRFGQAIVDFSAKIIRRVRRRTEKNVTADEGKPGSVISSGKFSPAPSNAFLLHRHVAGCQELGRSYMAAGIPFRNERGKSPLESVNRVKAWRALDQLSKGQKAAAGFVHILVSDAMKSIEVVEGHGTEDRVRLVVHGGKSRMEKLARQGLSLDELAQEKILTKEGVEVIKRRQYSRTKYQEDFEYYDRVVQNGYDLGDHGPTITTIHGSKGRQRESVVVFAEMGRKCLDDYDTEHRLAYVAATRTQGDVTICKERTVEWATVAYDYPTNKEVSHAEF